MLAGINALLLHLLLFFIIIKLIEVTLVDTVTTVIFECAQDYAHCRQDLFSELCER